jgi:hypothetical protein
MIRRTSDLHPHQFGVCNPPPGGQVFSARTCITNLTNGRSCPDSAGVPFEALVGIEVD